MYAHHPPPYPRASDDWRIRVNVELRGILACLARMSSICYQITHHLLTHPHASFAVPPYISMRPSLGLFPALPSRGCPQRPAHVCLLVKRTFRRLVTVASHSGTYAPRVVGTWRDCPVDCRAQPRRDAERFVRVTRSVDKTLSQRDPPDVPRRLTSPPERLGAFSASPQSTAMEFRRTWR